MRRTRLKAECVLFGAKVISLDERESSRAPLTDEAAVQVPACVARCNFSPPCAGLPYLCLNLVRHGEKLPRPPAPVVGGDGGANLHSRRAEPTSRTRGATRARRRKSAAAGREQFVGSTGRPDETHRGRPRRNQPMLILIPVALAGHFAFVWDARTLSTTNHHCPVPPLKQLLFYYLAPPVGGKAKI